MLVGGVEDPVHLLARFGHCGVGRPLRGGSTISGGTRSLSELKYQKSLYANNANVNAARGSSDTI